MNARERNRLPPRIEDIDSVWKELYITAFNNGGLSELMKIIYKDIKKLENSPVNIAITGQSGVGKSSFINSSRGLRASDEGAATVGIIVKPTKYIYPQNNNIALWDLPGVGTLKFPKKTYLQDVEFKKYDFFMILTANRLKEDDLWLGNEVQNIGKKFVFVRTKIDIDVIMDKYDNPSVCKDENVNRVRKCYSNYAEIWSLRGVDMYLIDNLSPRDYDFPILQERMIKNAPKLTQEALIFVIKHLTEDLINMKKDALLKRIGNVSLLSATSGSVLGLSGATQGVVVDTNIIIQECLFYRKQFGLDDDSLRDIANALGMTVEQLTAKINSKSRLLGTSENNTLEFVRKHAVSEAPGMVSLIPIIGSAISVTISYRNTEVALRSILDVFVEDILAINKLLLERLATRAESLFPCFFPECFFILI